MSEIEKLEIYKITVFGITFKILAFWGQHFLQVRLVKF